MRAAVIYLLAVAAAALAPRALQTPVPPSLTSCGGAINWTTVTFSPAIPIAGQPVVLNVTGLATSSVLTGGAGNISAYLWDQVVFEGAITACDQNQTLDIDGLASVTFNGVACPLAAGAPASLSLSLVIPSAASGIGAVGVIVNASDGSSLTNDAFCLNATITF